MNDNDLSESEALRMIGHGAVVSFGGESVKKILVSLLNLVLTTSLSASAYGLFALGRQFLRIVSDIALMGTHSTMLKYIAAYDEVDRRNQVVGLTYLTTLCTSGLLTLVFFLSADQVNAFTINRKPFSDVFRLFILSLFPIVLIEVNVFLLRATEDVGAQILIASLIQPSAYLIGVSLAVTLGYTVIGVTKAFIVTSGILALAVSWFTISRTELKPRLRGISDEAQTFYNHAMPNALSVVATLLRFRFGFLLVGYFLTATDAGIYNLALLFGTVLSIPLVAFNQLLPPVASRLYEADEIWTLQIVYRTVTRLIVIVTTPMLAFMFVFRTELLGLFGSTYTQGGPILAIVIVAFSIDNAVGGVGWLLEMTEHQYARMELEWIIGLLNVFVSTLLVIEFGLMGVAIGTALSVVLQNILQVGLLWRTEHLQPFDATFLAPLAAGLASGVIMSNMPISHSGVLSLGVGAISGGSTYLIGLWIIGIQPRDRMVFNALLSGYQTTIR